MAVKIMPKVKMTNYANVMNEIFIMKKLDHPNIVKLFEVMEDSKNVYLVQEYLEGEQLFEGIVKNKYYDELIAKEIF